MNNNKYKEIIDLPHHISTKHPRMSIYNRSAQFAPFSALTGYSDAIKETARLTEDRIELDDGIKLMLNDKLNYLESNKDVSAKFTYFEYDKRKKGGKYIESIGSIKKIDKVHNIIVLHNGTKIIINEILNLSIIV